MKIIGIEIVTTNQNGKNAEDLGFLWNRFFTENIGEKIPNKINSNIYAIYTDYESDFTGKYKTIIGYEVSDLENIPENLIGREFVNQNFKKFLAKGEIPNAVVETWKEIWRNDENLNRNYIWDYELYSEKSNNGNDSEVEIFIGVK